MARPPNRELKEKIRAAKARGATIEELEGLFGLTRNTIFYHLKQDGVDGREVYTPEQRAYIARLSADKLHELALEKGKSYQALQRVAHRERLRMRKELKAKVILQDYLDFVDVAQLREFGFKPADVSRVSTELKPLGLVLKRPNILVHAATGRWIALALSEQEEFILNPVDFLKSNAASLKARWKEK